MNWDNAKWKRAIEMTLKMEDHGSCGFCCVSSAEFGLDWSDPGCSNCPLNFSIGFGERGWVGDYGCAHGICNQYIRENSDTPHSFYAGRKHFWTEFAMSNPELKVDIGGELK